jgi:hypothetical protein
MSAKFWFQVTLKTHPMGAIPLLIYAVGEKEARTEAQRFMWRIGFKGKVA